MPNKQATVEELVSHMFIMGRIMRDKMHRKVQNGQCTMLEFETMKYVKDTGQPHMRDVAKAFHVTPPAATLMIDGLVKEKFHSKGKKIARARNCEQSEGDEEAVWNPDSRRTHPLCCCNQENHQK